VPDGCARDNSSPHVPVRRNYALIPKVLREEMESTTSLQSPWHGVVWDIDAESGVHLLIRETRGRVFYHRDLIA